MHNLHEKRISNVLPLPCNQPRHNDVIVYTTTVWRLKMVLTIHAVCQSWPRYCDKDGFLLVCTCIFIELLC